MIDETAFDHRASAAAGSATGKQGGLQSSGDTGEKSAFRQTLEEIREKGFRAYTEELQEKKLEELREKMLEAMGLSEDDLAAMSPERRAAIESMINDRIRQRLSAETILEKGDDPQALAGGSVGGPLQNLPNALGVGLLMAQEQAQAPHQDDPTR